MCDRLILMIYVLRRPKKFSIINFFFTSVLILGLQIQSRLHGCTNRSSNRESHLICILILCFRPEFSKTRSWTVGKHGFCYDLIRFHTECAPAEIMINYGPIIGRMCHRLPWKLDLWSFNLNQKNGHGP